MFFAQKMNVAISKIFFFCLEKLASLAARHARAFCAVVVIPREVVLLFGKNNDREWKVYGAKCMYIHMIPTMATGNKW